MKKLIKSGFNEKENNLPEEELKEDSEELETLDIEIPVVEDLNEIIAVEKPIDVLTILSDEGSIEIVLKKYY